MFRQLLTPVGDSLGLSFLVAALPIVAVLVLLGVLRRPAWQASLAGLVVGLVIAITVWQMPVGLAFDCVAARRGVRAVAGDVDRVQCAAALQHRRAVRPVRCVPRLGGQPSAERPPRGAGGDRLLLRRLARGHRRLRHAGGDHQLTADSGRLSGARSPGLHADLQYRAGRVRRARRAGDRARRRHRPAGRGARRDDRAAAAFHRAAPAVLRHGDLRRRRSVRALWPVLLVAGGSFAIAQFVSSNFWTTR